jgi:hypothetical protein
MPRRRAHEPGIQPLDDTRRSFESRTFLVVACGNGTCYFCDLESMAEMAMTRDEARAKCIEAVAEKIAFDMDTLPWALVNEHHKNFYRRVARRSFDSLHGIARVNLPEATEEMIEAGNSIEDGDHLSVWSVMAATGNLTNPPETKP